MSMASTPAPPPATPAAHGTPDSQRFRPLWTIKSRFQTKTLTALAISPGGVWVASASLDCNLLFFNFRTGQLIGVLSFETRFYATSLRWYSDTLLYAGCSDGGLLVVEYSPNHKPPVKIRPISFKPFDAPITALALDPVCNMLAVGYGGKTSIFSGDEDVWKQLDNIPEPCEGPHGTVTALGFTGDSLTQRQLLIGHAKAGFCVWNAPGDRHNIPYDGKGPVCSIGSIAFSADGQFIAIATLDHSLVIYPMSQKGPVIHQRQILPNYEQATHRPIIPIALAANNLVLKGSTTGKVPVIDLQRGPLAPIEHDPQEIIRSLVTYNDRVIVGLSDAAGQVSQIKCYLDRTSPLPNYIRLKSGSDDPLFEIGIAELEKQNDLLARLARSKLVGLIRRLHAQSSRRANQWLELAYRRDTWIIVGAMWMFLAVLAVDPPEGPGPKVYEALTAKRSQIVSNQVSTRPPFGSHYDYQEQDNSTRYPNLFSLVTFCGTYVVGRFFWWGCWVISLGLFLVGLVIGSLIALISLFPLGIRFVMTEVPGFLATVICNALPEIPICPKHAI
ncbi:Cilia- and flagella-associated protein 44 [Ceratobasidium sp. UAMH 11750]|nr:Cilia- and flagella-associated protein 44 [Ceratobasidium sp. UAMH 11750]